MPSSIKLDELTVIDNVESEAPKLAQDAVKWLEQNITGSKYNDHK
jgi:hypothetical protein